MPQPSVGSFFTGLRARLLAIVLLAVVPMLLLLFIYASVENHASQDRARAAVQSSLDSDARSVRDLISQSRATLVTFGITFAIQAQRWDLAQGNAVRLQGEHPEYALIAATDATGIVRASSVVGNRAADISGDKAFRRAIASRKLTVSDFGPDPLTGKQDIRVLLPVYDGTGQLVAVEYIAFAADQLATRLTSANPPSQEMLVDGSGTIVVESPEPTSGQPPSAPDTSLAKTIVAQKKGSADVRAADGIDRQFLFMPILDGESGDLFIALGYSPKNLLAKDQRTFALTLAGFGAFSLLALLIAWLTGTYSVYRPAHDLQLAAERLSAGDLAARAEFADQRNEFGVLKRRFNDMAEALQAHVAELELARADLSALNAELEDRVRHRTAELEASNKELETFSYSVSHDLRSPLRAIDGFSLALMEDYSGALDEHARNDLQRIRENAHRMGELIDSLLKLSRLSRREITISAVDLSDIAQKAAEFIREQDPDRNVELTIAPGVRAQGDPALLRIVLENLLSNAWKFTSRHPTASIEFGTTQSDGETIYFVRDDGAGFDMAYANKLFGAFQRVHGQAEFPGIGIGLATTARIVRRHGGRIWAEGEPEKGATFMFTLR